MAKKKQEETVYAPDVYLQIELVHSTGATKLLRVIGNFIHEIDNGGEAVLHKCLHPRQAKEDTTEWAERLIAKEGWAEFVPTDPQRRLYYLLDKHDVQGLRALLEHEKLDLNAPSYKGHTPIEMAIVTDHEAGPDLLALLLEAGADVNCPTRNGKSPLAGLNYHIMFDNAMVPCYLRMIELGADVNTRCAFGNSLLWDALSSLEVVKALVAAGIDLQHRNESGNTIMGALKGTPISKKLESVMYLRELLGYRELSSLEEALKFYEGQVTQRIDTTNAFVQDFFKDFFAMVRELMANPEIVVFRLQVGAPVPQVQIDEVEKEYGQPVDPELKSFYQVANGVTLAWIHKKNPAFKKMKPKWADEGVDDSTVLGDDFRPNGLINLLSFSEVYYGMILAEFRPFDPENQSKIKFAGEEYKQGDFMSNIGHFDLFDSYCAMAMTLLHKPGRPIAVLARQHWGVVTDSIGTTFPAYLRFLINTKGLVDLRGKEFWSSCNEAETMVTDPHKFDHSEPIDLAEINFKQHLED